MTDDVRELDIVELTAPVPVRDGVPDWPVGTRGAIVSEPIPGESFGLVEFQEDENEREVLDCVVYVPWGSAKVVWRVPRDG
ncbi:MAG: hypothetical protein JW895_14035 [Thermoleophilaceae bacterium]|nr:hypothetical protein [Thermoleophilaceae bacterium]